MARTSSVARPRSTDLIPFLTAYDPSDLPGVSIDPLGFDRGYNCLADKLLPGLTNVARHPRYFGLICAGAFLGPQSATPTRTEIDARQQAVLRIERYWALANVLAAEAGGSSAEGVRGITFAQAHRETLTRAGRRSTGSNFKLLSRQIQTGALGIYGNVAHGMRLIDRRTLTLTSEFGERLGEAFLEETQAPRSLRAAVVDEEAEVGLDALRSWAERAHLSTVPGLEEAHVLGQALRLDDVRSRMSGALAISRAKPSETELQRLERIEAKLGAANADLAEAIRAILEYEQCYAWSLLAFERVLWACRASGSVRLEALGKDEVLERCARSVPRSVERFERAMEGAESVQFRRELDRLQDVRAFLGELAGAAGSVTTFTSRVLVRHADVQHGKFDRGRRKLPWIEVVGPNVMMTMSRASDIRFEPRRPEDVKPHDYRTISADALITASEGDER